MADKHAVGVGRRWASSKNDVALLASCAELHEVTSTGREPTDDGYSDGTDKELEPVLAQGQVLNEDKSGTACFLPEDIDKLGQIANNTGYVTFSFAKQLT